MQGKGKHVLRGRVFIYGAVLLALVGGLFYSISQRMPLELDIIRDRNTLYRETNEGFIENVYTLKLINMDKDAHQYHIWITGLEGGELHIKEHTHYLFSGEVLEITARVVTDPIYLERTSSEVMFHAQAIDKPEMFLIETGRFVGPVVR
jgi:polyferredoxin